MPSRCSKDLKEKVLDCYKQASTEGVSQQQYCELLQIHPRRFQRWHSRQTELEDRRPGSDPGTAPHGLLKHEKEAIKTAALREEYADLSHRELSYRAMDEGSVTASESSFYRVMRDEGLTAHRGIFRPHKGHGAPPEREELTGPFQRLSWDISYVRTFVKWVHLFLYVVLDEWSRKVIAWRLDSIQSKDVAKYMLEEAFISEGIPDNPDICETVVINDRGSQMKAKTIKQMFVDLGVEQRFTRPRTPDDNPYVESFFRTTKYHPAYPGRFRNQKEAEAYFEQFFTWYNTEHLHSGICYVTPADKHSGRAEEIFRRRAAAKKKAREARLKANRQLSDFQRTTEKTPETGEKQELCVVFT